MDSIKQFINNLCQILDRSDQRMFFKFMGLLFLSGILSSLSIGAVLPLVHFLMSPEAISKEFPWFTGWRDSEILLCTVLTLILVFWLKNLAAYIALSKQSRFLFSLAGKIRKKLFATYMHAPYSWHIQRSTPALIRNINNEIIMFTNNIIRPLGVVLTEIVTSFFVFLVLIYINPIFAITLGVMLGAFLYVTFRYTRQKMRQYSQQRAETGAEMNKQVIQGLGGIKETKLYAKEHHFLHRFNAQAGINAEAYSFSNIFQQSFRLIIETVAVTLLLIMVLGFIQLGYSGQSMLVLMSVFGVASVQLLPSLNRLFQAIAQMRYALPALDTISKELKQANVEPDSLKSSTTHLHGEPVQFNQTLTLDNIDYAYEPGQTVLKAINLSVTKGSKIAFVGESGAGKTTLVDLIMGILKPTSGRILVDGVPIQSHNTSHWQRHFGYIPQMIYLYDGSIRENIAFGLADEAIDDAQVWACLETARLKDFVADLPQQLDSHVGENGIKLSGGQRQRIGIARAIYHNPEILVMDEATAALDAQTEREVVQALDQAVQNRTLITNAHRLSTIMHYDMIYEIDQGQVINQGRYEQLLAQSERFRKTAQMAGMT